VYEYDIVIPSVIPFLKLSFGTANSFLYFLIRKFEINL